MVLLNNLKARTGADLIGDDAQPTLTITNTSTGDGLKVTNTAAGNALNVVGASSASGLAGAALRVSFAANVAGATVAPLAIIASTASQAFISFSGVFLSSASYGGLANTNAFVIPVYHETQRVWGYLGAQKALV